MTIEIAAMFKMTSATQIATRSTTVIWLVGHQLPSLELLNQLPRGERFYIEYIIR